MKKSKCINNSKNYDLFDNSLTQKKEEKNISIISLQENNSLINMPSGISYNNPLFPSNYPITPLKRRNDFNFSSKKNKNFSSSGLISNKSKNYNINNNSSINDNYAKRKLFVSNQNLNLNNQNINNNFNINLDTFLNNLNNAIGLFTPPKKAKKEKSAEKNQENKLLSNSKSNEEKKEKEKNDDIFNNDTSNIKHQIGNKLFFTDYGLGYKCNCSKTGCNKFYCQCYNQGRYCYECNCQNCQNKKPDYISSNKRPKEQNDQEKQKTLIISCTCTKSGCNKNYCECYKNKVKCNNQCRCRNCENMNNDKIDDTIFNNQNIKYQCCEANSISIIKNKIIINDVFKIRRNSKIKIIINDILSDSSLSENIIGKKNKRNNGEKNEINLMSNKKSKISEDNTNESLKGKKNELSESDLFDKEGKLILTHIKI